MANDDGDVLAVDAALLTAEQAWTLCGLSKSAWYKYHSAGKIPAPVRIGGALRWRRDELLAWINAGCPSRTKWEAIISAVATKPGRRG